MATAPAPNPRASLLAGLRTGGVRSTSSSIPHTAAPGGSFNINPPRFSSNSQCISFPEEEDIDEMGDMFHHNHQMFTGGVNMQVPMTAAVDGPANRFSQHQMNGTRGMNPHSAPFNPAVNPNLQSPSPYVQTQALQMQLMQLEIMRLQVRNPIVGLCKLLIHDLPRQSRPSSISPSFLLRLSASSSHDARVLSSTLLPPQVLLLVPSICVLRP
jgi:hypothetical protein